MIRFSEGDVLTLLPMPEAIECLRKAFAAYHRGDAQNQPRRRLILPTGAVLHSMAAAYGAHFGTKVYSTHVKYGAYFTFLLYDAETARPLAQFEANHLGQIRTGAASGLAADLLAPDRPVSVGIIGSGFQARTQVEALRCVRRLSRIRVWSRSAERRDSFAADTGAEVAASADEACEGADIVVTATHSKDPVLDVRSVGSETLVLAMGSNVASRRELPAEVVERARIIVDDIEQCKIEAGDLILANVDWGRVETLGSLAAENSESRRDSPAHACLNLSGLL